MEPGAKVTSLNKSDLDKRLASEFERGQNPELITQILGDSIEVKFESFRFVPPIEKLFIEARKRYHVNLINEEIRLLLLVENARNAR